MMILLLHHIGLLKTVGEKIGVMQVIFGFIKI